MPFRPKNESESWMEWTLENTVNLVDRGMSRRFYADPPLPKPRDYTNPTREELIQDFNRAWKLLKEFREEFNNQHDRIQGLRRENDEQEQKIALLAKMLANIKKGMQWELAKMIGLILLWEGAKWLVSHPQVLPFGN